MFFFYSNVDKDQPGKKLTINSDLAVTIRVTGCEESLGLGIGESSGSGTEVLQEQPGEERFFSHQSYCDPNV